MAQRDLATDESASKSLDANAEFVPFRIGSSFLPSRAAGERSPLGEGRRSEGRKARDLMIEVRDKKIEMDSGSSSASPLAHVGDRRQADRDPAAGG